VPREVYLVKVGMTMTEGMVTEWYVGDGQTITWGDMVYALETEKVNLDVDEEISGTLKHVAEIVNTASIAGKKGHPNMPRRCRYSNVAGALDAIEHHR
jgi:hypothetical protein